MNFKIEKDRVRILEPFAIFGIIVGVGINIIVPLIAASAKISSDAKAETTKIIWLVASVLALAYSLIVLKYLFKKGALDRLLYLIMATIFVIMVVVAFYLP
jgi:hypothetical protein